MKNKNKILVLGVGGFVGSSIFNFLNNISLDLTPSVRRMSSLCRISKQKLTNGYEEIDFNSREKFTCLKKYDTVVHAAIDDMSKYNVNFDNFLANCLEFGVKKVLYISTIDVYDKDNNEVVDEKSPLVKNGDKYGDTKIDAEITAYKYIKKGLNVVIIRPGIIYGPLSQLWSHNIIRRQKNNSWHEFNFTGTCNLTFIDDLSNLVSSLIEIDHKDPINIISESLEWNEFLENFRKIVFEGTIKKYVPKENFFTKKKTHLINFFRNIAKSIFISNRKLIMRLYTGNPLIKKIIKRVEVLFNKTPSQIEFSVLKTKYTVTSLSKIDIKKTKIEEGLIITREWYKKVGLVD